MLHTFRRPPPRSSSPRFTVQMFVQHSKCVLQTQCSLGGWSFGRGGVFWGKRRHHQRGKNKTVNIFECVVAIGAASDGLMWAEKGVNGGWEWEFRVAGRRKCGRACWIPVECVLRLCFALCRLHLNILHMRKVEHQRLRRQTLCCSQELPGFLCTAAAALLIPICRTQREPRRLP